MEKVRIGMTDSTFFDTLGARDAFFTWGEGASGKEQRSGERRKTH